MVQLNPIHFHQTTGCTINAAAVLLSCAAERYGGHSSHLANAFSLPITQVAADTCVLHQAVKCHIPLFADLNSQQMQAHFISVS